MKIIYEVGDQVIVKATGDSATVTDVDLIGITLNGNMTFPAAALYPLLNSAVLRGEFGRIHRVIIGMPGTFGEKYRDLSPAIAEAEHYNQELEIESCSDYELVWTDSVEGIKKIIRQANGENEHNEDAEVDS